ncbi:diguanylate cyclase [Wenzhouxiangella sp. EGI_FJ10409]|uniref:diguanylate cyclase n=1 Tax=Wenzhouxiangella sp. EGI_FJ10409 TaxID=3243767 RepID=UPI0035DC85E8
MSKDTDRQPPTDGETVLLGTTRAGDERHEACLVIIRGARLGSRIVPGEDPLVIGRSVDADFQISDRSISRRHCRIFRENGRYWVEDLGSTNHTWLNDKQIDRAVLRDGDHLRISQSVLKFVDEGNIEAGYHSELHESTIRDTLTGLYNRRHAMAVLEKEASRAQRDADYRLALVILDLDFFKEINDDYGHLAGDGVLRQLSAIARERVRGSDTLARIGGEEFALILPDAEAEEARRLADAIRATVEEAGFRIDDEEHIITLSAGVATWQAGMQSISELLQAADRQLYEAKSSGRNRVC